MLTALLFVENYLFVLLCCVLNFAHTKQSKDASFFLTENAPFLSKMCNFRTLVTETTSDETILLR